MTARPAPRSPDPARDAAFDVLRAIEGGATWPRARRHARACGRDLDRRFAFELASGATRLRGRLDWIAAQHLRRPFESLDADVRVLLRAGLYQLLEMDRVAPYSAVHATVELAKRRAPAAAGFVNAVLRAAQRTPPQFPDRDADPVAWLATSQAHPAWIAARWIERFGLPAAEALCAANNRRPELCVRVNVRRAGVDAVLARIPGSTRGRWSQACVRAPRPGYAAVRAVVEAGLASVQDESASLVAPLLDPRPDGRVVDLAAAPGGKTCHLAELVAGEGIVVAVDRAPHKLGRVRHNAARLGLANVACAAADARRLGDGTFDAVLVDAPCSGLGVLARRPDLRWRKRPEDLPRLATLQLELLEAAARLVRPHGLVVYSVCSFEAEETLDVAQRFAASHPEMRPESAAVAPALQAGPGVLYSFPHLHGMDGGFAARWRRVS